MERFKLIVVFALVCIVIIVLIQNVQSVETKFLFITITMPRAVLLLLTFLFGLGTGILASVIFEKKSQKQKTLKDTNKNGHNK